jgi:hypothetical protein
MWFGRCVHDRLAHFLSRDDTLHFFQEFAGGKGLFDKIDVTLFDAFAEDYVPRISAH